MALKSGNCAATFALGAAGVGWVGVVFGVAMARPAPAMYRALTGAAIVAAPRRAAIRGFLRKLGVFIDTLLRKVKRKAAQGRGWHVR
jgi:hypothetical protein